MNRKKRMHGGPFGMALIRPSWLPGNAGPNRDSMLNRDGKRKFAIIVEIQHC